MPGNKIYDFLQASVISDDFSNCGAWDQKHLLVWNILLAKIILLVIFRQKSNALKLWPLSSYVKRIGFHLLSHFSVEKNFFYIRMAPH